MIWQEKQNKEAAQAEKKDNLDVNIRSSKFHLVQWEKFVANGEPFVVGKDADL